MSAFDKEISDLATFNIMTLFLRYYSLLFGGCNSRCLLFDIIGIMFFFKYNVKELQWLQYLSFSTQKNLPLFNWRQYCSFSKWICGLQHLILKKKLTLPLPHFKLMFLFYTPWKHKETSWFSDVFRGYRNGTLA